MGLKLEKKSGDDALILRDFTPDSGDEERILAVFEEVFGRRRDRTHLDWKFRDNPYHGPLVTLATDTSDELAAHYAVMPVPINYLGRPKVECQSLDTMVRKQFRRRQLFEKTALHCYENCRKAGIGLVYGFPGPMSYPGFVRKLNWRRVATMDSYVGTLNIQDRLRRLLPLPPLSWFVATGVKLGSRFREWLRFLSIRLRLPRRLRHEVSRAVPEGYDDLWHDCVSMEVYSVWKDAKYFQWRYDRNPETKFHYHSLRDRQGQLAALAVVTVLDGEARICEWVVRDKARLFSDCLLSVVRSWALKQREAKYLRFEGFDNGFFQHAFRRLKRDFDGRNIFAVGFIGKEQKYPGLDLPHNWTVTLGDRDFE